MKNSIPDLSLIKKETADVAGESSEILQEIKNLQIHTSDEFDFAVKFTQIIKDRIKEIDNKRKSFTTPLNKLKKDIDAFFNTILDPLKQSEKIIKTKLLDYTATISKDEEKVEENPKNKNFIEYESWDGEIEDAVKIILYAVKHEMYFLLNINTDAIIHLSRIQDSDPKIPGWKAFKKKSARIKTNAR